MNRLLAIFLSAVCPLAMFGFDPPTMGWSSWNTYRVNINDSLICCQADALMQSGLKEAGYTYVNIDDGFFGGRDEVSGSLKFHPERFPNGLRNTVDHIHSLGLKAGIYSDAGANTCGNFWDNDTIARNVGLLGHELEDCRLFFGDLGFDFIKVDYCGADGQQNEQLYYYEPAERYSAIARAIAATGRDDVRMNVCRWAFPGTWVRDVATSWRTTSDIYPSWESVRNIIAENLYLSAYAGNGCYNDMDMLEIGRGMSREEDCTHFAMWCMMSSPLLIGCDLTTLSAETLELLTNPELIAINQDILGLQAYVAKTDGASYVLVKDVARLDSTTRAVALYNPTDSVRRISVGLDEIQLSGPTSVRDVLNRIDLAPVTDSLSALIPPHGVGVYLLDGRRRIMRKCYEAENAFLSCYQELYDPDYAGTAYYAPHDKASGGMVVRNMGLTPANDMKWNDVAVENDGDYMVSFKVFGDRPVEMLVFANDGNGKKLSVTGDGEGEVITAMLHLSAGRNTIRVASRDIAPDIDYMTVETPKL